MNNKINYIDSILISDIKEEYKEAFTSTLRKLFHIETWDLESEEFDVQVSATYQPRERQTLTYPGHPEFLEDVYISISNPNDEEDITNFIKDESIKELEYYALLDFKKEKEAI